MAAWADDIRSSQPETRPWCFADIPSPRRHVLRCPRRQEDTCTIARSETFRLELAEPSVSRAEKLTALELLVHLVGDLHQPLQCVDDNGRGGNALKVRYAGRIRKTDLHSQAFAAGTRVARP